MLAVSLKGLATRKFRASLTAIAIVLGVAMISGTYVLTDTINNGFDTIFTQSYKNADVVVSGKTAFLNANGNGVETPSFPESVLAKVRQLPDVAVAAGSVTSDQVRLLQKNGKIINTGGAPPLGFSVDPRYNQFNPTVLTAGEWPRGPKQIAIDNHTHAARPTEAWPIVSIGPRDVQALARKCEHAYWNQERSHETLGCGCVVPAPGQRAPQEYSMGVFPCYLRL